MKKEVKPILVGFIAFYIIGGTYLGVLEYKKEREARVAFEDFYNPPEVKGAYVEKSDVNDLFRDVVYAMVFITVVGVTYSFIKRKKLEQKEKGHHGK